MEFDMLSRTVFAKCDGGTPTQIFRFDNVSEFVAAAEKNPYRTSNTDWANKERASAIHCALHGDEAYVPGALDLLAEVDAALPPTVGAVTVRSPYGGRVDMGDWLHGSPTPMRRKHRTYADHGPVKILVSFGPSASLGAEVLLPRGNAIMALIMKIQQYRPVELFLYDETRMASTQIPCYILIGVECRPLSLAHIGFAVSDPAFFRQIGLGAEFQQGANASAWPVDMNQYTAGRSIQQNIEAYNKRRDERIGVQPEDLILSSATDWNPLIHRPVEWIKAELQRIGIEV